MIKEIPSISNVYRGGKTAQYSLQKRYKFLHYCVVCKQPMVTSFTWAEAFLAQPQGIHSRDVSRALYKANNFLKATQQLSSTSISDFSHSFLTARNQKPSEVGKAELQKAA